MWTMPSARTRWRSATVLLASGALGVHQLRYLLAFGGDAGERLASSGHGYLGYVTPLVAALSAMALGRLTGRVSAAWRTGRADDARSSGRAVWLTFTLILLGVYAGQELAEGLLGGGPDTTPVALLAHGGWLALPLAAATAGVMTLALKGADAAVALVARAARARRARPPRRAAPARRRPASIFVPAGRLLPGARSQRGPPALAPVPTR
jgi:hypothetical protein